MITVGNSYIGLDIDNVYIFGGSGSCCVRDTIQAHMRRQNINDCLKCYIGHDKVFNMYDHLTNYNLYNEKMNDIGKRNKTNLLVNEILNMFDELEIYKLIAFGKDKLDNNIIELLKSKVDYIKGKSILENAAHPENFVTDILKKYEIKYNEVCKYYNKLENFLDILGYLNHYEDELNNIIYFYIFEDYLKRCNYKIELIKSVKEEKITVDILYDYNKINLINSEIYINLINKPKHNETLTKIEKKQINKYNFNNRIDITKNKVYLEFIYTIIYNNSKLRQLHNNNYFEIMYTKNKKKFIEEYNKELEKSKNNSSLMNTKYLKLNIIHEINKIFNLKNSIETKNIIIDRESIEKLFKTWLEKDKFKNLDDLEKVFSFRNKIIKNDLNFKKLCGLLNRIYNSWNGTQFFVNESDRKEKPINYKMLNLYEIYIESYKKNDYYDFDSMCDGDEEVPEFETESFFKYTKIKDPLNDPLNDPDFID
jgi:hypothetical protein